LVEAGRRTFSGFHDIGGQRKSLLVEEPLSYQRVHRASHAAAALFKWCTTTLIEVMDPEPDRRSRTPEEEKKPDSPEPPVVTEVLPSVLPPLATKAAATLAESIAEIVCEPPTPQKVLEPAPAIIPPAPSRQVIEKKLPAKPPRVLTESTPADRHFEVFAEFHLGNAGLLPDSEVVLQNVAGTWCMRQKLRISVQACPAKIESDALNMMRLQIITEWFADQGMRIHIDKELGDIPSGEPGVAISIHIDNDRSLKEFYILRDDPDEDVKFPRDVNQIAQILEQDFKTCKH
jgi:hypothetical protein